MTEKLYLTIEEAAQYAGIGICAMREFCLSIDPPPMLLVGNRKYVQKAGLAPYLERKQEVKAI